MGENHFFIVTFFVGCANMMDKCVKISNEDLLGRVGSERPVRPLGA